MRNAEFGALSKHDRNRFVRSIDGKGGDLFGNMLNEMEIRGPYLSERERHLEMAVETIGKLISENPQGLDFGNLAAQAQQSLFLKRSELGDIIVEMAQQGLVQETWRERNGRKPNIKDVIRPL